jgi:hypothetical protein
VLALLCATACGARVTHGAGENVKTAPVVRLPAVTCTRYASPSGDDRNPGSARRPFRYAQTLINSLRPGQTGCLEPGIYQEDVSFHRSGTPSRPIVLAGALDGRATLLGALWIAGDAQYVTVRNLDLNNKLDGARPSPQVNGNYATFYDVDVTNEHTGICFILGGSADAYGVPIHTTIARSRIHDCGQLPPAHFEHGIYLAHARDATIVDNYVYDNADWGLHLYPDAQSSNVQYNVFDGNGDGVMIAGTGDTASSGNTIAHNIISNSTDASGSSYGHQITSFWGDRVGSDNLVASNCFWHGASSNVYNSNGGFTVSDNTVANPRYVSRSAKDFRLRTGSRCAGDGPR